MGRVIVNNEVPRALDGSTVLKFDAVRIGEKTMIAPETPIERAHQFMAKMSYFRLKEKIHSGEETTIIVDGAGRGDILESIASFLHDASVFEGPNGFKPKITIFAFEPRKPIESISEDKVRMIVTPYPLASVSASSRLFKSAVMALGPRMAPELVDEGFNDLRLKSDLLMQEYPGVKIIPLNVKYPGPTVKPLDAKPQFGFSAFYSCKADVVISNYRGDDMQDWARELMFKDAHGILNKGGLFFLAGSDRQTPDWSVHVLQNSGFYAFDPFDSNHSSQTENLIGPEMVEVMKNDRVINDGSTEHPSSFVVMGIKD